jgi:hypothetical protein
MKNREDNTKAPSDEMLSRVRERLESFGLEVGIGG